MRVKENLTLQEMMYDFFEIRNIGLSSRTNRSYNPDHLIGRFSYESWLDKPFIICCKWSGITQGSVDAYYISTPNVKAYSFVINPTDFIWKVFHNKGTQITFEAIKNTMEKHYGINCEFLSRKDAITNTEDVIYNIRTTDGKYFCFVSEIKGLIAGVAWGYFWTTLDKNFMKSVLPDSEYHNYRLCAGGVDDDEGTFIDLDSPNAVGLDELIPNFNVDEFRNNFITEMELLVD